MLEANTKNNQSPQREKMRGKEGKEKGRIPQRRSYYLVIKEIDCGDVEKAS